jgi:DNA-binding transcriptional LysR family regulator
MPLDLEALRTLVAVVEAGGLTAASGPLGRTTSAISRRIAQMESQVGATLLDRATRQLRLTQGGRTLFDCGRQVIADVDAAVTIVRRQQEDSRRDIVLATFDSMTLFYLPAAIKAFAARYPVTHVRIREMQSSAVIDAVARQSADFGIANRIPLPPNVSFQPFLTDAFVLACTKKSRLARRQNVSWKELAGENLIGFATGTVNRTLIDRATHARNIFPNWQYEVQTLSSAMSLLENDIGLVVLPTSAITRRISASAHVAKLIDPVVSREVGIVRRKEETANEIVAAFLDVLLVVREQAGRRQARHG